MAEESPAARAEDRAHNRALWALLNERFTGSDADRAWRGDDLVWGLFGVPDAYLGVLGSVQGLDVVELACGTAYLSAWLARRGARPVGLDNSAAQLATGQRMAAAAALPTFQNLTYAALGR